MSWEKYAYTSAGAAMLSESISGGALTITRAVSGTGTIDTDLSEETAVSGDTYELKLLGIDTVEYKGEKARKVSIWTGGADEPYFMHQIGVFGRLNDDPEDTLLFLMQDDRGIEIPAIGTAEAGGVPHGRYPLSLYDICGHNVARKSRPGGRGRRPVRAGEADAVRWY